jgi:hypothetical protein
MQWHPATVTCRVKIFQRNSCCRSHVVTRPQEYDAQHLLSHGDVQRYPQSDLADRSLTLGSLSQPTMHVPRTQWRNITRIACRSDRRSSNREFHDTWRFPTPSIHSASAMTQSGLRVWCSILTLPRRVIASGLSISKAYSMRQGSSLHTSGC